MGALRCKKLGIIFDDDNEFIITPYLFMCILSTSGILQFFCNTPVFLTLAFRLKSTAGIFY
jgi:hypothetical protein